MAESDFRLMPEGAQSVVIRRSFDVESDEIMPAFTDPDILRKWIGGPGMPLSVCEVDARPGGRYRICWDHPDGTKSWMAGVFHEVTPTRIVATEAHRPDWTGGEMRVTTELRDHEDRGWLRRTIDFTTPAARNQAIGTLAPGTRASFDRLEKVLTEEEE
jgi:uncharacterized protein YndB with AHSA1/START domain